MNPAVAVIKYDGRIAAFSRARLEHSLFSACLEKMPESAAVTAATAAAEQVEAQTLLLPGEGRERRVSSDEIRTLALDALRNAGFDAAADAYTSHYKKTRAFIAKLRVIDPNTIHSETDGGEESFGLPWDRRRLADSMLKRGAAEDPALEAARSVERKLASLGSTTVTPALVHALAVMELSAIEPEGVNGLIGNTGGARGYQSSRIAYPAKIVHGKAVFSAEDAEEAFWLQACHSRPVAAAAAANLIAIDPFPQSTHESAALAASWGKVLPHELGAILRPAPVELLLRAAPGEQSRVAAEFLAGLGKLPALFALRMPSVLVELKAATPAQTTAPHEHAIITSAPPVTVNAGGLVLRESVREVKKAARRLAELAGRAMLALREREEHAGRSPVRGNPLPVAVSGLWNAAALLRGSDFWKDVPCRSCRVIAIELYTALDNALREASTATGVGFVLDHTVPPGTGARLAARDLQFASRDMKPGAEGETGHTVYSGGLEIHLSGSAHEIGKNLALAFEISAALGTPPGVVFDAPLFGDDPADVWLELIDSARKAGLEQLRLLPGGGARRLQTVTAVFQAGSGVHPLLEGA